MIKRILLGAFCMAQFSLAYAIDKPVTSNFITVSSKILSSQQVPKTVIIKTKKFKIRIDKQPNGKYLYQSWAANARITSKPSMIISDGELIPDGSGGNYYFSFANKGYTYQIWRNYLTDSASKAPYTLTVNNENDQEVVRQDGFVVKQ
ncbi:MULTISPECIES: hypothetical protein [Chryseobacterium]|uniref:Uncharacterized protein n=1 Tax=Chryseobacterium lathyri TaxID=395933 RepID=A0A511Y8A9_9FLAO|nr:hypothetical protein [Chryseobacterium lathyri]GEN71418.1 hypothetical protein CLA01_14900 [Chryseobacterium lathyri]